MPTVAIIPEMEEREQGYPDYTPTKEEEERGTRVHPRIDELIEARRPYEPSIERGLMLYDGIHLIDPKDKSNLRNDNIVAPFARIFVDAKTAEETKAIAEYTFTAVEDAEDTWKVNLLKEVNNHVIRKIKQKSKRHELLRTKNICGVSIARLGYRRIMGKRKIRIQDDEYGDMNKWKEMEVPVYDDIFMDIVSPLNFAIDPNATSMDDAMDCVHFHVENVEAFREAYGHERFKNVDKVKPGVHGRFSSHGFSIGNFRSYAAQGNMVLVIEYFNKIRDEWIVYANGIEIYCGPLPDDHKELPFMSYHNSASFCTGFIESTTRSYSGEDVGSQPSVRAEQGFWTQGDPQTIMDLIELRTAHGRAAHRAIKRSSQVIIATKDNFSLPADQKWMDGMQAKGALGKVQVLPLGVAQAGNWQWAFDDLFIMMRLAIGIDPSNLADTKQKTATEAEIQWETSMRRLEQNLEYNEENGEVRMGMIIHKLIQQRYTKPEIVRITGYESEDEIGRFDDIEKDEETGIPKYGKRYRRIKSSFSVTEEEKKGKYKLSKDDAGVNSFIARPEYIRTSDIDIAVDSSRRANRIKAIEFKKSTDALNLFVQLIPLSQKDPMTGEPLISKDDLPNLKKLVGRLLRSMDLNPDTDIGQGEAKKSKMQENVEKYMSMQKTRVPLDTLNAPVN
jgi:predicted nucleotidyltransferase